jgi:hypothetical protein
MRFGGSSGRPGMGYALAQFPKLDRADQMKLKSRAILTAKTAFKIRLTKLGRGRV